MYPYLGNSWWRSKNKKKKVLVTIFLSTTILYAFLSLPWYLNDSLGSEFTKKLINPPLSTINSEILRSLKLSSNFTNAEVLDVLSDIVQSQLRQLQNSKDCLNGGFTLHCGHDDTCGLGCQLHHRVACLAMSYTMGIPLIHDLETAWSFSDPWEDAFLTLGSILCPVNEKTIHVKWRASRPPFMHLGGNWCRFFPNFCPQENQYEFPMRYGLPIARELGLVIEENSNDPFLWMMGQFTKYTMKLSNKQQRFVDNAKQKMGLDGSSAISNSNHLPLVGFHVRRTDKKKESEDSYHDIDIYMKETEKYFQRQNQYQNSHPHYESSSTPKEKNVSWSIFIASDDHTVLFQARKKFQSSSWNILGVENDETLRCQKERKSHLREIARDIVILSECDYIICGYSSNVCRLLLEMVSYKAPTSFYGQGKSSRLKSLDGEYSYLLYGFTLPPKLIFVDT